MNKFLKKVAEIQQTLKAPKNQFNKFGGYAYRNCEDILEAVKPLLGDLVLTVSDKIITVGEGEDMRVYVEATAKVTNGEEVLENTASAREPLDQKGMNEAQITGSASSYARKYALNGLFLIDDTKDADATNDHGKGEAKKTSTRKKKEDTKEKPKRTRTKKEEPKEEPEAKEESKEEPEEKPKKRGRGFRRKG